MLIFFFEIPINIDFSRLYISTIVYTNTVSKISRYLILIFIGAKLAVAPVARATPLFLPRPEIIYINVLHFSAPPRTYLVSATPLFRPLWRHCLYYQFLVGVPICVLTGFILFKKKSVLYSRGLKLGMHK